jgi:hypothetical protein
MAFAIVQKIKMEQCVDMDSFDQSINWCMVAFIRLDSLLLTTSLSVRKGDDTSKFQYCYHPFKL